MAEVKATENVQTTEPAQATAVKKSTSQLRQYLTDGGVKYLLVKDKEGNESQKELKDCDFLDKHCGLYFSAHWCGPCRQYTPTLAKMYKEKDLGLTIIFNSWDQNAEAFKDYYKDMPWASIPFEHKDALEKSKAFKSPAGIPALYLFDDAGKLYQTNGRSMIQSRPFPYTDPQMSEMLPMIVSGFDDEGKKEKMDVETLKNKEYFGLYFSAHWCPPCRAFTPKLSAWYEKFTKDRDDFELIFISADRDEASWKEYFETMSFKSLDLFGNDAPAGAKSFKNFLNGKCEVNGIPHLAILSKDGDVLCKNARSKVEADQDGIGKGFPWITPAVQDPDDSIEGINETPSLIVLCEEIQTDEQEKLLEYITPHAKEQAALKGDRELMHFFLKTKCDIGSRIRGLLSMPLEKKGEDDAKTQCMVILNIQRRKFYKADLPQKADDVTKFFSEFSEGVLEAFDLNMPGR